MHAAYSIVAAEFNKPLIDAMIVIAQNALREHGLGLSQILRVPGCYEMPLIADRELAKPAVAGLIVLGCIERGETLHGEVMGHAVSKSLIDLQLKWAKPIGLGLIGPGATAEQAQDRHASSARAAVMAVKRVAELLRTG